MTPGESTVDVQRVRERLVFLSELGRVLAEEGDVPGDTLQKVARLAVESMACFCIIDVLENDGTFVRVAAVAKNPALQPELEQARHLRPPRSWLRSVVEGGHARICSAVPPEHLALTRDIGVRSALEVPMRSRGRVVGVLSLLSTEEAAFLEDDARVAEEAARRIAAAMENARLLRETAAAERRACFLAEAGHILAGSLDYRGTLESIVKLAVPTLADWCAIDMLSPQGEIQRLAVQHPDPRKLAFAEEVARDYPPDPREEQGLPAVLRTGRPEWMREIPQALLVGSARDQRHLDILLELGLRSYICVPIAARGRVLGVLSLVHAESGRLYDEADFRLAQGLGRHAGLAVDNARLYGEAQAAVRLRDEFLSVASHELKTPLTPLRLRLHQMERDARAGCAAGVAGHVEVVHRQVRRLGALVDGLLDVSRITSGRLPLEREDVDLAALTREVISHHAQDAERQGGALTLEAPERLVGHWDRLRLEQVLTNLVSNAIKYGNANPIHVVIDQLDDAARIRVIDEGIGIDAADLDRIFERFERAVSGRHFGGLGLGLYITRSIVEALGGRVTVASTPGKGSTFTVVLPRFSSAASATPSPP